ncbi:MAG TPA: FadR/GntR family transcriptional regulator [Thermomicrobiales bacterium]|nr:FadR/GntR family transcriptional regulator [Thermomicrobiales bacterium]
MIGKLANIDPIKREPLTTQVARRLVEYILSGRIEPGDRMPSERQLAEAFGVGRSAMREALKALTLIGLLDVRQGDGTYLKRADSALLPNVIEWGMLLGEQRTMDLVEARQHVEPVIAGLAARRRSEADLTELRAFLMRMERSSEDHDAFVDADVAFHQRLADATGNSVLKDIHSGLQSLSRAWIHRVISSAESSVPSYREHIPIYDAVERGDPAAATAAMEQHMTSAADRLRRALAAHVQRNGTAQNVEAGAATTGGTP